uniref:Uncharacterized protein LOC102809410 n=1 Tax=Saccoglossus kowalevskii TaxID=10224 RepID=A0ABM0MCN6_SACKO|nr:PREDICTED: uncharacterized protein LOC102809410 [Saccoglossus kowalevskii]
MFTLIFLLEYGIVMARANWNPICVQSCDKQLTNSMSCDILERYDDCTRIPFLGFTPVKQQDLPQPPVSMNVTWYPSYWDGAMIIPALNVSVTLITADLGHVSGLVFILRGLTNNHLFEKYSYFGREICQTFNFSGSVSQEEVPPLVTFYWDCFRPLSPYSRYQIEVIVLPVADTAYKTNVKKEIIIPYKIPYWGPAYVNASSIYSNVYVTFDLPPVDYLLDRFHVYLYRGSQREYQKVILPGDISRKRNQLYSKGLELTLITATFYDVEPGTYTAKIMPKPTNASVCKIPKQSKACLITVSLNFTVSVSDAPDGKTNVLTKVIASVLGTAFAVLLIAAMLLLYRQYRCKLLDNYIDGERQRQKFYLFGNRSGSRCNSVNSRANSSTENNSIHQTTMPNGDLCMNGGLTDTTVEPSPARVMLLCSNDNDHHMKIVLLFAEFLASDCDCHVVFAKFYEVEIAELGIMHWVCYQFEKASKIIIVMSDGVDRIWRKEPLLHRNDFQESSARNICNNVLSVALNLISHGDVISGSDKYVYITLSDSRNQEIHTPIKVFGTHYRMPRDADSLYINLNRLPGRSLGRHGKRHLKTKLKKALNGINEEFVTQKHCAMDTYTFPSNPECSIPAPPERRVTSDRSDCHLYINHSEQIMSENTDDVAMDTTSLRCPGYHTDNNNIELGFRYYPDDECDRFSSLGGLAMQMNFPSQQISDS